MNRPIIFLDVDGVLVAYPEGEHMGPSFTPRCVEAFKSIVDAVPDVRVVISSTWRLPLHVNHLHEQWLQHGLPLSLACDSTPDTREDPTVSRLYRRGLEIEAWLKEHAGTTNWVLLDDEKMAIEPILGSERSVFTNPARGLTPADAERAIAILNGRMDRPRETAIIGEGGVA